MKKRLRFKRIMSSVLSAAILATSVTVGAAGFTASAAEENGVWAEYYGDESFTSYAAGAKETGVGGAWDAGSNPPGLTGHEHFSAKWIGRLYAAAGGQYQIISSSDDGVKISVNGAVIINDAGPHGAANASGMIILEAGSYNDFTVEYYNGYGGGSLELSWIVPGESSAAVIPDSALFMPKETGVQIIAGTDTVSAKANVQNESDADYTLVLEEYDAAGALADKTETPRPTGSMNWESAQMEYKENCTYKAYVTNDMGEVCSDTETKQYGVDSFVDVDFNKVTHQITDTMYGACLEDVNHEIYGGLWSQLIYDESFFVPDEFSGFTVAGGEWTTEPDGTGDYRFSITNQNDGPKLVVNDAVMTEGEIELEMMYDGASGNTAAGLIIKSSDERAGADNFTGYEVGFRDGTLVLGRHNNNFTSMGTVSGCPVKAGVWFKLKITMTADSFSVYIDDQLFHTVNLTENVIETGRFGFRAWSASAKYRNIRYKADGKDYVKVEVPRLSSGSVAPTSRYWQAVYRNSADGYTGMFDTDTYNKNAYSQNVTFTSGSGAVGIANMALNKKGMNFVKDKNYEGFFMARSADGKPATVWAVLESYDGSVKYAEKSFVVSGSDWEKYSFDDLIPDADDNKGRFTLELREAGSADFGYVYLQPGEWGRFEGLNVRKDVAEKLKEEGLTVLRMGGGTTSPREYRWKGMIGPQEERKSYWGASAGHCSLGFGIIDFMNLCEVLGIPYIPTFNKDETAQDMADFIDFALGTDPENEWTALRISMGREEPYNLKYIEIGNENRIDDAFAANFTAIADAVWSKEGTEELVLVVGDFDYKNIITDPYNFTGAASGQTTLKPYESILAKSAEYGRQIYIDIHMWTDRPSGFENTWVYQALSLYDALGQIAPEGSEFYLAVFEFNAWIHSFSRALGNANGINALSKYGDIFKIICSANCLQVDGHNDDGWNQGLLFMNNDSSWFQPPAYAMQLAASVRQNNALKTTQDKISESLNCLVTKSDDGKSMAIKVVNYKSKSDTVRFNISGIGNLVNTAEVQTLTADSYDTENTADSPNNVVPVKSRLENPVQNGSFTYTFPADSYTVIMIDFGDEEIKDENAEAAAAVDKLIGELGEITSLEQKDAVESARSAYEALSDGAKALVTKLDVLVAAEEAIKALETPVIEYKKGDIDKNGSINVSDMLALKNLIMSGQWNDEQLKLGDMDDNKTLNVSDMLAIKNLIMSGV